MVRLRRARLIGAAALFCALPASAQSLVSGFVSVPPPTAITIGADGKKAVIRWDGGTVRFEGDMPVDEAARRFFTAVASLSEHCQ